MHHYVLKNGNKYFVGCTSHLHDYKAEWTDNINDAELVDLAWSQQQFGGKIIEVELKEKKVKK